MAGLCDTALTEHQLRQLLIQSDNSLENGNGLVRVEAHQLAEQMGITSKILRVILHWWEKSGSLPSSVIVKVIGNDSMKEILQLDQDPVLSQQCRAHNIECSVYDLAGLAQHAPMPKCYGKQRNTGQQPGIIILEDLTDCTGVKRFGEYLNRAQVDQMLDILTTLHAWSVNTSQWRASIPTLAESDGGAMMRQAFVSGLPQSKRMYPEVLKDLDEKKVAERINNEKYLELYGCDPKAKYNLPCVLVHGDVHVMNMLWGKREDGVIGDEMVALIDWQNSHKGCPMEDINRLMNICISAKMRKEEQDNIIQKYVQLFNGKVTKPDHRVTLGDCKTALNDMFVYSSILWTCAIGMFKERSKEWDEQHEGLVQNMIDNFHEAMKIVKW